MADFALYFVITLFSSPKTETKNQNCQNTTSKVLVKKKTEERGHFSDTVSRSWFHWKRDKIARHYVCTLYSKHATQM